MEGPLEENTKSAVLSLASYFNRGFNDYALHHWCGKLYYKKLVDVKRAVEACMGGEKYFPTLDKFLWYVDQERYKRETREREEEQKKKTISTPIKEVYCSIEENKAFYEMLNTLMSFHGNQLNKKKLELKFVVDINNRFGKYESWIQELEKEIWVLENPKVNQIVEFFNLGVESISIKSDSKDEITLMEG